MKKYIGIFLSIVFLVSTTTVSTAQEDAEELDLRFFAAPLQVKKGDRVRLDWESDGAQYCTASGLWSGRIVESGSTTVKAKKTGTYAVQCFDEDGIASKKIAQKITVAIGKKKPKRKKLSKPTPVITAPQNANEDEDVVISWKTPAGTTACKASGPEDWEGLKPANGTEDVSVETGKEYALSCWNENGEKGAKAAHTFKPKPNRYSATDVGLSAEYQPMYPDDASVGDGTEVYFIDFIKREERFEDTFDDDVFYFGKRIVIDPDTNLLVKDKNILKQLYALPEQVPPDVDRSTKRINASEVVSHAWFPDLINGGTFFGDVVAADDLKRFLNSGEHSKNGEIPTITPDDARRMAIGYTLEYLDLPREDGYRKFYNASQLAIWFSGLAAGPPMYFAVDVYNAEDKKILTVVMDPYTGTQVDDQVSQDMFDKGVWDRTILKKRDQTTGVQQPATQSPATQPPSVTGQPVANPPTQTPVTPPSEPVKEEQKKEETTTKCSAGFVWSPTLGQCYEDASAKQDSTTQPTCAVGYSYSITLKQCVR
ncbi:hypothetical protein HY732_04035 [Candidatus Uhrbacteria bacterium]|nr:hypothetical protein [Candidatus Uhrbacteria bacterium]